jgi:hypothetical protein
MKKLNFLLLLVLAAFAFSCNDSGSESEEGTDGEEATESETSGEEDGDAILQACIDEAGDLYGDVLDAESYCGCAMDIFMDDMGMEKLADVGMEIQGGNSTGAFEQMLNELSEESKQAIVSCLSGSIKNPDAKLSELSPEMYQYTIDGCVAEVNRSGGLGEISGEEYCTCFFDKIKDDFTYAELLEANTNPDILPMDVVYECLGMEMP